ncbi:hypothetical protein VTI74DRAFT_3519 [Chaetomium olivicolor]
MRRCPLMLQWASGFRTANHGWLAEEAESRKLRVNQQYQSRWHKKSPPYPKLHAAPTVTRKPKSSACQRHPEPHINPVPTCSNT